MPDVTTANTPVPTLTAHQVAIKRLNATYRFRHRGPTFEEDEKTGRMKQIDAGGVFCDIIDLTTNEHYATGVGIDETLALENAITKANTAPKPLTPAQKADIEAGIAKQAEADSKLAEANAEIERLKAELAASKPKRGRPPKEQPEPVEEAA